MSTRPSWGTHDRPIQLDEPMSFTGATCRIRSKGAEMTQSCITKSTPAWATAHQSWIPGAHCMDSRQLNRLESVHPSQVDELV